MSDEKFLSFEDPIKELAQKLSALRTASVDSPALNTEIKSLEKENIALTKKIYSKLDTWQIVQVARHPNRPHTSDYIKEFLMILMSYMETDSLEMMHQSLEVLAF